MNRFSGPITIERLVNVFINLFIWRLMMMAVNKTIEVMFGGVRKLFARKTDPTLPPPESSETAEPQLRDFSRPRD